MENKENKRYVRRMAITLAKYIVADDAFANEKRWIRNEKDFTDDDEVTISENTETIMKLLNENNGGKWADVLKGIHNISENFHFGFKHQDVFIERMKKHGYVFN